MYVRPVDEREDHRRFIQFHSPPDLLGLSDDFVQHVLLVDEVTAALYQLEQLTDVGIPLGENLRTEHKNKNPRRGVEGAAAINIANHWCCDHEAWKQTLCSL